ncbi:hypothetical protein WN943_019579 [Citrus x changshan-huyou]
MKKFLRLATGVHAPDIYLLTLFGPKLLSIPSHNRVVAYWENENHASNACHFQLLSKIPSLCTTFPSVSRFPMSILFHSESLVSAVFPLPYEGKKRKKKIHA